MSDLPNVDFRQNKDVPPGLDLLTYSSLRQRERTGRDHDAHSPHKIRFNALVLYTGGAGHHVVDFTAYPVRRGSLLLIREGQVNQLPVLDKVEGKLILFTREFIEHNLLLKDSILLDLLHGYQGGPFIAELPEKEILFFDDHFQYMVEEFHSMDADTDGDILHAYLQILLIRTSRLGKTGGSPESPKRWFKSMVQLGELLDKEGANRRNADWYAQQLGLTYKSLNLICRGLTGNTVKSFISKNVILQIKRDLVTGDDPVKELSWRFHFDEPTNFVKFFRRHTGSTPDGFRRESVEVFRR